METHVCCSLGFYVVAKATASRANLRIDPLTPVGNPVTRDLSTKLYLEKKVM